MLFPLVKRVDWTNPLRGAYQFVMIGVMGVCLYFYDGSLVNIGQNPVPVQMNVVGASSANSDIALALKNVSLKDKEKLFKVFSGIVDYSQNSERTHSNRQIEEMITEVILTYKLENFANLDSIIQTRVKSAGLEKDMKLVDSKDKIAEVFGDLAKEVKLSIQTDKDYKGEK